MENFAVIYLISIMFIAYKLLLNKVHYNEKRDEPWESKLVC